MEGSLFDFSLGFFVRLVDLYVIVGLREFILEFIFIILMGEYFCFILGKYGFIIFLCLGFLGVKYLFKFLGLVFKVVGFR